MRNDIQPIPDPEDPHLHAEYCPCYTCVRDRRFRWSAFAVGLSRAFGRNDKDIPYGEYGTEEDES